MFEVIIGISILAVIIGVCAWFFDQIISPVFSWLGSNPVMAVILVVVAIAKSMPTATPVKDQERMADVVLGPR